MVDLRDPEDLLTLLRRAKGSFGIVGEPAKGKLCIRITEEDRARIERALTPWWRRLYGRYSR